MYSISSSFKSHYACYLWFSSLSCLFVLYGFGYSLIVSLPHQRKSLANVIFEFLWPTTSISDINKRRPFCPWVFSIFGIANVNELLKTESSSLPFLSFGLRICILFLIKFRCISLLFWLLPNPVSFRPLRRTSTVPFCSFCILLKDLF